MPCVLYCPAWQMFRYDCTLQRSACIVIKHIISTFTKKLMMGVSCINVFKGKGVHWRDEKRHLVCTRSSKHNASLRSELFHTDATRHERCYPIRQYTLPTAVVDSGTQCLHSFHDCFSSIVAIKAWRVKEIFLQETRNFVAMLSYSLPVSWFIMSWKGNGDDNRYANTKQSYNRIICRKKRRALAWQTNWQCCRLCFAQKKTTRRRNVVFTALHCMQAWSSWS